MSGAACQSLYDLPEAPGVYALWDDAEMRYIGRAINLRSRVRDHRLGTRQDLTCLGGMLSWPLLVDGMGDLTRAHAAWRRLLALRGVRLRHSVLSDDPDDEPFLIEEHGWSGRLFNSKKNPYPCLDITSAGDGLGCIPTTPVSRPFDWIVFRVGEESEEEVQQRLLSDPRGMWGLRRDITDGRVGFHLKYDVLR